MVKKAKKFSFRPYDRKHLANLLRRAKSIDKYFDEAAREGARIGEATGFCDPDGNFYFSKYPAIAERVNTLFEELHRQLQVTVEQGNREEWLLSCAKNDAMVDHVVSSVAIPKERLDAWKSPNIEALEAFQQRKTGGMNLSERVWKLTDQFKGELELALEMGLGEGKSAAALSRDVRQYLHEPSKLFRRVRDEKGVLRLSKAAAAYHPGQGVYRSSYKNALRLTATENNMAYRTADHERWQQLDFVIGIEIKLSNNHTCVDSKGVPQPFTDICDTLAGVYPKTFKFTGWHPFCRCIAVPKLAEEDDFIAFQQKLLDGEDIEDYEFGDAVTAMPDNFTAWVKDNAERIERATTEPYFIRDNRAAVHRALTTPQSQPTIQEIAAKRHAERDEGAIQGAWNNRRLRNFHAERDRYDLTAEQRNEINDHLISLVEANSAKEYDKFNSIFAQLQTYFAPIRKAQLSYAPINASAADVLRSSLMKLADRAESKGIDRLTVQNFRSPKTTKEIIERLGGGDKTEGSCSSLALAYAGNRGGLDVLDFRGGKSREFFCTRSNVMDIVREAGGTIEKQISDFTSAKSLLGAVTEGTEYYFCCAGHAAVVRKVGDKMQYLELQTESRNGWKDLNESVLKCRFGAKKFRSSGGVRYGIDNCIIDITKLTSNKGFRQLLGYINTNATKQVKGLGGAAK